MTSDAFSEKIALDLSRVRLQEDPFLALPTLLPWIREKRWFMDKEAKITGLEQVDSFVLVPGPDPAVYGLFVALRLADMFVETQKRYFIPIILSSFIIPDVLTADTVCLELTDGTLYWSLAEHSKLYQEPWLRHLAAESTLMTQRGGRIRFQTLSALQVGNLQARCLNVSTSNVLTLIDIEGEGTTQRYVSKTYKDLRGPSGEPGRKWPSNYEALRYEALTMAGYPNIPRLHGLVFYIDSTGYVSALGAVMEAVDKEDEVGVLFWNGLSRYLKTWAAGQGARDEHFHQKYLQGITAAAREIARTIAGMHAGFLTSPLNSFRPAAASVEDLQRWSEAPLLNVEAALSALRERHAASPDSGLGVLIQKLERLLPHFAPPESGHEQTDLERVARVLRERGQGLMKTQIHGDLNTAQGLIAVGPGGRALDRFFDAVEGGKVGKIQEAANELVSRVRWIDFEGVPAKTLVDLTEDGRNSPFLDLGGIAQGCWYIANLCCYSQLGLNTQDHPENRVTARRVSLVLAGEMTPEEAAVPGLTAALSDLINGWFAAVTSAFLSGYLDEIEAHNLGVNLLTPWDRNEAKAFMYFWILIRATHELRYETYGRDWGWEAIPGGRILQILRLQDLASAL